MRVLALFAAAVVLGSCNLVPQPTLTACADPNNLPFSNRAGEGFENKLAALIASDLHARLDYVWWAQRRGYVRNTLGDAKCDFWPGIGSNVEMAATTRPYYRSTYVFVTRTNDRLSGLTFKVIQMPAIVKPSVPFLGVQGFMVTKFAATHGVGGAATDLVTNYLATPSAQTQLAAANGRPPANVKAHSSDPVLSQFSAASKGGVPMPNIPQMNSVWGDLGQAWVKSTKGAGATKASVAFKAAARSIADKIG